VLLVVALSQDYSLKYSKPVFPRLSSRNEITLTLSAIRLFISEPAH